MQNSSFGLAKEGVELSAGWTRDGGSRSRSSRGREIFAKVEPLLVYDPVGHRLAAFVVEGFVVKFAIETGVLRPVALGTKIAKADAIANFN